MSIFSVFLTAQNYIAQGTNDKISQLALFIIMIAILAMIVGFFVNIVMSDCCAIFILVFYFCGKEYTGVNIHEAIRVVIAVVVALIFFAIFNYNVVVSRILSIVLSILWALALYAFLGSHDIGLKDTTWKVVISVFAGLFFVGGHIAKFEDYGGGFVSPGDKGLKQKAKRQKTHYKKVKNMMNDLNVNDYDNKEMTFDEEWEFLEKIFHTRVIAALGDLQEKRIPDIDWDFDGACYSLDLTETYLNKYVEIRQKIDINNHMTSVVVCNLETNNTVNVELPSDNFDEGKTRIIIAINEA